jgi:hypothetical protein
MRVTFCERPNGPERLICEAEIAFDEEGPLQGMKLVGFSVWRGQEGEIFVTFPARSFGVGGERRFFDLFRAIEAGSDEPRRVKDWILDEYRRAADGGAVAKTA